MLQWFADMRESVVFRGYHAISLHSRDQSLISRLDVAGIKSPKTLCEAANYPIIYVLNCLIEILLLNES
jgi:hypothetical protein